MELPKLKVMIVDDEELARKMLAASIDWSAFHMELAAEAVSGLDALSLMEEQVPDILFTDIKMPYMDGMELCRLVTKRYPHIKIVILTAFKDFEYAHECIRLGVSHFLLKPIDRTALKQTVLELYEQIESEKKQWLEFDHIKQMLEKNYAFIRESFLVEFCENSALPEAAGKQMSFYYPDGVPEYIQVTLLASHSTHIADLSEEEHILQDMKNREFIKNYLRNMPDIEVLADSKHHLMLFSYSAYIQMEPLCEQIQRSIRQTLGYDILFGIGNSYCDFYRMADSYSEALEALKFSLCTQRSIIIYQNDLHVQASAWHPPQTLIEDIKFYIKAGMTDTVQKQLSELYQNDAGNVLSLEHARILSMTLLASAANVANDIGLSVSDLSSANGDSYIHILLEPTCQGLKEQTTSFLVRLTREIEACRVNKSNTVLWEIIQYIQKEVANPKLSLGYVADAFHMNDSYLSRIFKKELGFNFSKYLNRLRMERAIELLNTTDLKAYQIAEAVGIPDAYYFSNCFKKYTGQSVRDYRKGAT